jgi:hypothetical protein
VPLAPKAVETLLVLVENAGHLVEKAELMQRVWPDAFVEEGNRSRNIYSLRKLLGCGVDGREYVETMPKRGYRFVAEVSELPPPRLRLMTDEILPLDREMSAAPLYGRAWLPAAFRLRFLCQSHAPRGMMITVQSQSHWPLTNPEMRWPHVT